RSGFRPRAAVDRLAGPTGRGRERDPEAQGRGGLRPEADGPARGRLTRTSASGGRPMKRWHRRTAALVGAIVLGACADAAPADPQRGYDIDGRSELEVIEELRLGSATDRDAGFSQISHVEVTPSGLVLVLDFQDQRVKVYDSLGIQAYTIGGRGEGPGEFTGAVELGLLGDTLWVRDARARRTSLFTLAGTLLATVPARGVE